MVDGDYGGGHASGSVVKNPPDKKRDWDPSLGREDPLKNGYPLHIAWRIPQTDEPGGSQSTRSQRAGHG